MNDLPLDRCPDSAPARPGGVVAEVIRTPRMTLTPMSSELVRLILTEDWVGVGQLLATPFPREWRADGWQWLTPQATNGEHDHRFIIWGTRLAFWTPPVDDLDRGRGPVIAEAGFHGPPDADGWVEIGYRVVVDYRRRGLAAEAAEALLAWAAVHGAIGVKASVSPGNVASLNLLYKLGFAAAGCYRHDILGEQLILRRPSGDVL